jgi:hypothetical protein
VISKVGKEMMAVTKYLLILWLFIIPRGKESAQFYVRRKVLVPVQRSPCKKHLQCGRDEELMMCLASIVLPVINRFLPRKRTRIFNCQDAFGLSLVWMNSS